MWLVCWNVCFCILKVFLKKIKFFLKKINVFLVFSDHFDVLMLKIIFKKNMLF
jgi:hypothetical protein